MHSDSRSTNAVTLLSPGPANHENSGNEDGKVWEDRAEGGDWRCAPNPVRHAARPAQGEQQYEHVFQPL